MGFYIAYTAWSLESWYFVILKNLTQNNSLFKIIIKKEYFA